MVNVGAGQNLVPHSVVLEQPALGVGEPPRMQGLRINFALFWAAEKVLEI